MYRVGAPICSFFPAAESLYDPSGDVIHSFACPSLGIKTDAYPGRLNQVSVFINREGVFYGQCSEICGILHSSMPIVIESVNIDKFVHWLYNA